MKWFISFLVIVSIACANGDGDGPLSDIFKVWDVSTNSARNVACSVRLGTDMGSPQPLQIIPGTNRWFHPVARSGVLEFTANQEVELFCTNGFSSPLGITANSIRIACTSGTVFRLNGVSHNFNAFTCRNWPTSNPVRRATTQRCFGNGIFVDHGFQVDNRFLNVFTTCHNLVTEENHYTIHFFTPVNEGNERSVTRPSWSQGPAGQFFPGKNVDNLHTRFVQRQTIATILNSQRLADLYIEPDPSDVFLARGHIAAMTDFISANEQRATFYFTNTAPQWQTFNALNWVSVEISSRRLASDRNLFLDVYSGTFGIGQLRDEFGIFRDIHLAHSTRQIPMPRIYYKMLINNAARSGVVLIGVNNFHLTLTEILADYVICNDVGDRITYVTWQRTNLRRGYSYACEVQPFLARVPHIPGLTGITTLLV